jgi:predicted small lipoprotein YifL
MRLTVISLAERGQAKRLGYIAMLFCLVSVMAACGRKGMPIAPETPPPPKVTDLSAVVYEGNIVLKWSLATGSVAVNPQIEGFYIYR